jgi:hypothetical protein
MKESAAKDMEKVLRTMVAKGRIDNGAPVLVFINKSGDIVPIHLLFPHGEVGRSQTATRDVGRRFRGNHDEHGVGGASCFSVA